MKQLDFLLVIISACLTGCWTCPEEKKDMQGAIKSRRRQPTGVSMIDISIRL